MYIRSNMLSLEQITGNRYPLNPLPESADSAPQPIFLVKSAGYAKISSKQTPSYHSEGAGLSLIRAPD